MRLSAKMADERAQAISFIEYYAALVDGIFPLFETYLAEDVVLHWFKKKKIRGKRNVATFMNSDKINTLHIFTDIVPISDIIWTKEQCDENLRIESDRTADVKNAAMIEKWRRYKNAIKYLDKANIVDHTMLKKQESSENTELDDQTMDNEEDNEQIDLNDLFESKITSLVDVKSINEVKLEEEMASTIKPDKRECGQGDGSTLAEVGTIKYVKASGQVKFTRKEDRSYHWISQKTNCWNRKCTLQIAYSHRISSESPQTTCTLEQCATLMKQQNEPSNLEEVIAINDESISDKNNFDGYVTFLDYTKDRDNFLRSFEVEMVRKNPNMCHFSMHYEKNKLVLECKKDSCIKDFVRKRSNSNYQIHRIVYEGIEKNEKTM